MGSAISVSPATVINELKKKRLTWLKAMDTIEQIANYSIYLFC